MIDLAAAEPTIRLFPAAAREMRKRQRNCADRISYRSQLIIAMKGNNMNRTTAFLALAQATGRLFLAAPFISGGLDYFRDRKAREGLVRSLGIPAPEAAALVDAIAKIACGFALAVGVQPELSAAALIVNLAPMTVAIHPFWKAADPESRSTHLNAFSLNVAVAGGLLAVAAARRSPRLTAQGSNRRH